MALHADPEVDTLIERWQRDHDERARDALLRKHEKWFWWMAGRWGRRYRVNVEDAVQVARIAFVTALDKYDVQRGVRLTTYAENWVRAGISRSREELGTVHIPVGAIEDRNKVGRTAAKLHTEGASVSRESIAARLGWTVERVTRAATRPGVALDAPLTNEDGATTFMELLEADESWRPDAIVDDEEDAARIRDAVETAASGLSERNGDIFRRRFVEEQTLEVIGQHYDLTRERVRQLLTEEIIPQMRLALRGDPRIADVVPDRVIDGERAREDAWFKSLRAAPTATSVSGAPGPAA